MQRKIADFFKRIKVTEDNLDTKRSNDNVQQIEIEIQEDSGIFKNEKDKIMQGARELLKIGKADNMEDAIVTFAVMFRGLKFSEVKKTKEGTTVVVLRDTVKERVGRTTELSEIGDR